MSTTTPESAIRFLGTALRIARALLIVISVLVVALTALAISGTASMSVTAELEPVYSVEFEDGRRITVGGDTRSFENFEIGRENVLDVEYVAMTVDVADDDTDTRIVLATMFMGWLAASWIIVLNLMRLVDSAAAGNAFGNESPGRLRRIGTATVAFAIVAGVGRIIIGSTLDVDAAVDIAITGAPLWIPLAFGIGMYALAEVFAEAVRLREFEEATV